MKRVTIKEAFNGEVKFTKYIASNRDVSNRLLECIDENISGDYSIVPEDKTVDSKRVDLVIRNTDGDVHSVIESQDATGWLDTVHSSKIAYYAYEKGCEDGVLLTEDADENVKGFLRWYNENTPLNIWLIKTLIYELPTGEYYVDFINVMRPFSIKDKKITSKNSKNKGYDWFDYFEKKYKESNGFYTHFNKARIMKSNITDEVKRIKIFKKNNYYNFEAWVPNQETVKDIFSKDFPELEYNPRGFYGTKTPDWETANNFSKRVVKVFN